MLLHALHRLRISLGPSMPMSLAVVFIGIWTVPSTVSAQLSFTSPAPLNNDAAGDTAHDIHPELACDGAGTCVTVWRLGHSALRRRPAQNVPQQDGPGTPRMKRSKKMAKSPIPITPSALWSKHASTGSG